jgi:hypothetical protein
LTHASRRLSFAKVEQSAQPCAAADATSDCRRGGRREWDEIAEALVIALGMVMRDELANDDAEVALAERDDVTKAFLLDGSHEAFREGIEIGSGSHGTQESSVI